MNSANRQSDGPFRYTPVSGPNTGRIFRAEPVVRIAGVPMRLVRMRGERRWVPDVAIRGGLRAGTLLLVQ